MIRWDAHKIHFFKTDNTSPLIRGNASVEEQSTRGLYFRGSTPSVVVNMVLFWGGSE